ncbi:MAG: hypothetical protein KIT44_14545, partial [Opitutaceae bacterium]|nr:hypothetical protein [Opitutaceae bacterium]
MRSCKARLEQIADPANLREAFLRAVRGKSGRADVGAFRENLEAELAWLRAEILRVGEGGAAEWGRYTRFTIFEPKERVIHAPCFRERVL